MLYLLPVYIINGEFRWGTFVYFTTYQSTSVQNNLLNDFNLYAARFVRNMWHIINVCLLIIQSQ